MKLLSPARVATLLLLAALVAGCGGAQNIAAPDSRLTTYQSAKNVAAQPSAQAEPPTDRDGDNDGSRRERHDRDDSDILRYGHPAPPAEEVAIASLVKRYYRTAVAEDGARACSMMYSTLAEAVPEDFGTSPPAPAYAAGRTCPEVLTKVFRHAHAKLAAGLPHLKVWRVRVKGRHGLAVVSLGSIPDREFQVGSEGGVWRIETLMGDNLP